MSVERLRIRVAAFFEALEWVLTNIDAERASRRPQAGKWSAHEHLAHVACYQRRFLERLGAILSTDRPALARYRAEDDPDWPRWQHLSGPELGERFDALREESLATIGSLSDEQLARVGVHPAYGAMTVTQWIDFLLFHQ